MTTKKLISILLILCMSVSLLSGVSFAASIVDSGTCGDNLTWTLDSAGTLTITGTGQLWIYDAPWEEYLQDIVTIIIEGGVTSIDGFSEYPSLTTVQLPNSVTSIGDWAFQDCSLLESINLPNQLQQIGRSAFYGCAFTRIDIPSSVTSIGEWAFAWCEKLSAVALPSGLTALSDSVFYKTNLKTVSIPSSVTSIGENAFTHCGNLESINIPSTVSSIGAEAFMYCRNLKEIAIPKATTSIGNRAFHRCPALTKITVDGANPAYSSLDGVLYNKDQTSLIQYACASPATEFFVPETVKTIESGAFAEAAYPLASVVIPDSVTTIGSEAFLYCDSLSKVSIGSGISVIETDAFYQCGLTDISVSPENLAFSSRDGNLYDKAQTTLIQYATAHTREAFSLLESVTTVKSNAFHNSYYLQSILIPASVTTIESNAFSACYNLSDVYYPLAQAKWENISIASSNKYLNNATIHFECSEIPLPSITWSLDASGTLTISGTGEMTNYSNAESAPWYTAKDSITSVVIESGVTSVGSRAFYDYPALTSVSLPETIETISRLSFSYTNLTELHIPKSVTSIEDSAFNGCYKLTEITVDPDNTQYSSLSGNLYNKDQTTLIQYAAGQSLTEFAVPSGVTAIGDYAFNRSSKLTTIKLPASVISLGDAVFRNCSKLSNIYVDTANTAFCSVDGVVYSKDKTTLIQYPRKKAGTTYTVPNSVTEIADDAFSSSSLTNITLPNSLKKIGKSAFFSSDLTSIIIPKSVSSIGRQAFDYCNSLTDLYYGGSEADWENATNSWNVTPKTTIIHFNSTGDSSDDDDDNTGNEPEPETILASGTCGDNLTWKIDDQGALIISGEGEMEDYESYYDMPWREHFEKFQKLVIKDGVTSIGNNAFWEFGITSVSISDSVTSIGDDAFFSCSQLSSVSIPKSVTEIGSHAFGGCDSLSAFLVDEQNPVFSALDGNLYNKDQTVFLQYAPAKSASSFTVPGHVTEIGEAAFYGCQILLSVTIPDSVISLGEGAFVGCWSLEEITLSSSLTTIEPDTFLWCSALAEITIPDSVTTICNSAFYGCDSLAKITIPASVATIEDYAFHSDYNYCDVHVYYSGTEADWEKLSSNNDFSCDKNNLLSSYSTFHFAEPKQEITWTLDENGTLTLSGTGAMPDYSTDGHPWSSYIKNVVIEEGITSIGGFAFGNCIDLVSLKIPSTVTEIGENVFLACRSLTEISVDPENPAFSSLDGSLYNKDRTSLIQYALGKSDASFSIPNSVSTIEKNAFAECLNLTSVEIPDTVTTIKDEAFNGCSNLEQIVIPNSVETLGSGAFAGCVSMTSATLSNKLSVIRSDLFYKCEALEEITIPNGVLGIEGSAFMGCKNLKTLTLPYTLTMIKNDAFEYCTALTDVHYTGSEDKWATVSINSGNDALLNATIHFSSASLLGDINGDYSVDVYDAVLLFQHSMLPDIYPIEYIGNVDFNKDGAVDVYDAVLLFQYSMLPDLYPIG